MTAPITIMDGEVVIGFNRAKLKNLQRSRGRFLTHGSPLPGETGDRREAHLHKTIVLLVSLISLSSTSAGQRVTTLESLAELSSKDLSTAIVRVEYRGPQDEYLSPILFTVNGKNVDWRRLDAIQGLAISNWQKQRLTRPSFTVTAEDLKRFIEGVKNVAIPKLEEESWFSLAVVAGEGPEEKRFLGSVSRLHREVANTCLCSPAQADGKCLGMQPGVGRT